MAYKNSFERGIDIGESIAKFISSKSAIGIPERIITLPSVILLYLLGIRIADLLYENIPDSNFFSSLIHFSGYFKLLCFAVGSCVYYRFYLYESRM